MMMMMMMKIRIAWELSRWKMFMMNKLKIKSKSHIHFCLFIVACYEIECSIVKIDWLKTKLKVFFKRFSSPSHKFECTKFEIECWYPNLNIVTTNLGTYINMKLKSWNMKLFKFNQSQSTASNTRICMHIIWKWLTIAWNWPGKLILFNIFIYATSLKPRRC